MNPLKPIYAQLQSTPDVLDALFKDMPIDRVQRRYGPEAFSPYHVVAHLIIGEQHDWIPRLKHTLQHGTSIEFPPFNHHSTIDPAEGPSIDDLLKEFRTLREQSINDLQQFIPDPSPKTLELQGLHPAFGPVTIFQLISTWATHDQHHIAQICKGLACGAQHDVGPWISYLGILKTQ